MTKYGEEEIEFTTKEERIKKEDSLRDELVASLVRSMKAIPEKLGKGIEQAVEVEESIKRAMPSWLATNPVPNLAHMPNEAKERNIQVTAEQEAHKKAVSPSKDIKILEEPEVVVPETKTVPVNASIVIAGAGSAVSEEKELFEDDATPVVAEAPSTAPAAVLVETAAVVAKADVKDAKDADGFDVFSGEDIFGDTK